MPMSFLARELSFNFHAASSDTYRGPRSFRTPGVEVSLILEGGACFVVDGRRRLIESPCATMQVYHEELEVQSNAETFTRTVWCRFAADELSGSDWIQLEAAPSIMPIPPVLPALFTSALAAGRIGQSLAQSEAAEQAANFLGKSILAEYLRNAAQTARVHALTGVVKRAKAAIDTDFAIPWSIDALANLAGVNASHLISLFNIQLGITPMRYLWKRRLDAGLDLLRTTALPVEDIAFRCGFQSAAHFSRRVKQRTGTSPTVWRTNVVVDVYD